MFKLACHFVAYACLACGYATHPPYFDALEVFAHLVLAGLFLYEIVERIRQMRRRRPPSPPDGGSPPPVAPSANLTVGRFRFGPKGETQRSRHGERPAGVLGPAACRGSYWSAPAGACGAAGRSSARPAWRAARSLQLSSWWAALCAACLGLCPRAHYGAVPGGDTVSSAQDAARKNQLSTVVEKLKGLGSWAVEVATKIGCTVGAEAIKKASGLG